LDPVVLKKRAKVSNTNKNFKKEQGWIAQNPGALIKDETKISVIAEVRYCNFAHRLFQKEKQYMS
jgi:hypothetical protein